MVEFRGAMEQWDAATWILAAVKSHIFLTPSDRLRVGKFGEIALEWDARLAFFL